MEGAKWGMAFVLACPPCTAGLFLAIASVFGITAAAVQSSIAVGALSVLAAMWARNVWRRRGECAWKPSADGARVPGGSSGADA